MNNEMAKWWCLMNPTTGERFIPYKSTKRETGEHGFRILAKGSNRAEEDRVVQSENDLAEAWRMGLRVRCKSDSDPLMRNAFAIGGRRGLVLVSMSDERLAKK